MAGALGAGLGVPGERLGDEEAGVVDQCVDAAEARHGLVDRPFGRALLGDVAGSRQRMSGSLEGLGGTGHRDQQ
jgi:hypothetical protein